MAKKPLIVDESLYDANAPIATIDEIRKYNRQRFEMEQLTAILYDNFEEKKCVGYKDMTPDEFWVRGHMPDFPLTPGVVMCECAAQMASYEAQYVQRRRDGVRRARRSEVSRNGASGRPPRDSSGND